MIGALVGGLGLTAGVVALFVTASEIAIGLGGVAFALGVGAAILDGPACLTTHEMLACGGFALGVASSALGGGSFVAAAGGSETLSGGLGIFGSELGAGGLGLDLYGLFKHVRAEGTENSLGKDLCSEQPKA